MKRKITLFTHFYSDAVSIATALFRTSGVSFLDCNEEEWLYNDGYIRVECYDCVYYVYRK
jgi:hypothetical protein